MSIFKQEALRQSLELTGRFVEAFWMWGQQMLRAERLCKHPHITELTAWLRASPLSSSPTAQWCDCHPGPPRPAACRPLWSENQNRSVQHRQSHFLPWFSEVGPLLATWKQLGGFDLRQVSHWHWHTDHLAASVWGQLREVRWTALPWCRQTAETKRQQTYVFVCFLWRCLYSDCLVNFPVSFMCERRFLFPCESSLEDFVKLKSMLCWNCLDRRRTKSSLRKQQRVTRKVQSAHSELVEPFQHRHGF